MKKRIRPAFLLTLLLCWPGSAAEPAKPAAPPDAAAALPAALGPERVRQRAATRPATPDLIAAIWRCPDCGAENAAARLLPEQPPFDRLADVSGLLARVALGQERGWTPPQAERCRGCGHEAPKKLEPLEAVFIRYFPETGCDAAARARVKDGKLGPLVWGRLDVSGAYDQLGELVDERLFAAAFGRALAVREAWSEVAADSIGKRRTVIGRAGPGYLLVCRPAGADAAEEARLAAGVNVELAKQWGLDPLQALFVPLAGADPKTAAQLPTFAKWLPEQAREIAEGRFLAAAAIEKGAFRKLAARELAGHGVAAEANRLRVGDYYLALDFEAVEARAALAGLALGEGLYHFVWPEAARLSATAAIGDEARALLKGYDVALSAGGVLVISEKPAGGAQKPGAELARLNLFALAGQVDPERPGAVQAALSGLLGLDAASGKLRLPKATDEKCACGAPAWLARKLRPKGYFERLGARVAAAEWQGLTVAWSLDCPEHSRFIPADGAPAAEELEARYARDLERTVFHVAGAKGLAVEQFQARVVLGQDISAALADPRLRRGLAQRLNAEVPGRPLYFWAPTVNVVIVTLKPVPAAMRADLRRAAVAMARPAGLPVGEDLDLEINEKLTAEPAGEFTKPLPPPPAGQ